jgi:hypothetical protein
MPGLMVIRLLFLQRTLLLISEYRSTDGLLLDKLRTDSLST